MTFLPLNSTLNVAKIQDAAFSRTFFSIFFFFTPFPSFLFYELTAIDWLISMIHFNTLPKERSGVRRGDFGGRWRTLFSLMVDGYSISPKYSEV